MPLINSGGVKEKVTLYGGYSSEQDMWEIINFNIMYLIMKKMITLVLNYNRSATTGMKTPRSNILTLHHNNNNG